MWQVLLLIVAALLLYSTRAVFFPPSILERVEGISKELGNAEFESMLNDAEIEEEYALVGWIKSNRASIKYRRNEIDGEIRETIDISPGIFIVGLVVHFTDGIAIRAGSFTQMRRVSDHKVRFEIGLLKGKIIKKLDEFAKQEV